MTSKEKLIEFLESANIDYSLIEDEYEIMVDTEYVAFFFDVQGNFVDTTI